MSIKEIVIRSVCAVFITVPVVVFSIKYLTNPTAQAIWPFVAGLVSQIVALLILIKFVDD